MKKMPFNPLLSAMSRDKKAAAPQSLLTISKEQLAPDIQVGSVLSLELTATVTSVSSDGKVALRVDSVEEAESAETDSTDSGEMDSQDKPLRVQTQESHG